MIITVCPYRPSCIQNSLWEIKIPGLQSVHGFSLASSRGRFLLFVIDARTLILNNEWTPNTLIINNQLLFVLAFDFERDHGHAPRLQH